VTFVRSGSRLHFGLFNLPPADPWPDVWPGTKEPARYYGGVGVMVDEPAVEVEAEQEEAWSIRGLHVDRVLEFARLIGGRPHRIHVRQCAPQHCGLGVGTQLGLAIGTALTRGAIAPLELAGRLNRGRRSGIGVHGFGVGGLLIDGGKTRPHEVASIVARADVPPNWTFLLVTPPTCKAWSGRSEDAAIAALGGRRDESMYRLALAGLLPAVQSGDVRAFGAAVTEYNARAGELFRPAQGGRYSHAVVQALVADLLERGFAGAGQSSWGPTVFAVTDDINRARDTARRLVARESLEAVLTSPRNVGAKISSSSA